MIDRYTQNGYVTDFLNFAVNSFRFAITTTLLLYLSMTDSLAEFNYQTLVGTDGAEIFLADPTRLLEHSNDPTGWQHTAGATLEDRQNGHFLYFSTGGDGGFEVRVTDGQLDPRETRHAGGSIVLRLRIGQTGLLLDGGYAWPDGYDTGLNDRYGSYLDVPAGDYAATITVIDRPLDSEYSFTDDDDPEGPLADYVIQLEQVADIADVPMMDAMPNLLAYESPTTSAFYPMSGFSENCSEVPKVAIRMPLENGQLPAPGGTWQSRVPLALYEYVKTEQSSDPMFGLELNEVEGYGYFGFPSNIPVIVAPNSLASTVGASISVYARSWMPDENENALPNLHGSVRCAVTITGPAPSPDELNSLDDVVDFVSIVALPLDASRSDDLVSEALGDAYAGWLKRSTRKDVRYRLAAASEIIDSRHRFTEMIRYTEPPADQLAKWIAADAVSREKALTAWLEQQY